MNEKQIEILFISSSIISLISGVVAIGDSNLYFSIALSVTSIIFIFYILYKNYKSPINFRTISETIDLDIKDEKGSKAKYTKKSTIKCSKNSSYYFYNLLNEYNGQIENIEVSNGIIESIVKNNGIYNITSKLQRPYKKGEILNREIKCDFNDCFLDNKEFWCTEKNYPGSSLIINISFPNIRLPKTFSSYKKTGHIKKLMKVQPKLIVSDNRYLLTLEVKKAELFSKYYIEWDW